jgi:hypothetical protein
MNGDSDAMDFDTGMAIFTSYDAGGFLGIGIDVYGGQVSGTGAFDALFPYGTFGCPRDPDTSNDGTFKKGATALWAYNGKQRFAWLYSDPRVTPKLPLASKGSWGAYADTGREDITVMVLDGTTGSFALRVPHSGAGVSRVLVDVTNAGAEEILLANGGGCELAVKPLEVVIGDALTAMPLAQAPSVQGLAAALNAFAVGLTPIPPLVVTTPAQVAAAAVALASALAVIPPIPTTKLRSE